MISAAQIIEFFNMEPIPSEGGYFSVSHRDGDTSSAIMFLVTKDSFSRMHKLPADEVYHFYIGDPVEQLQLFADGTGRVVRLGHNILNGDFIQYTAPADCWQGTRLADGGEWALLGTTMAPAWNDSFYTDGVLEELLRGWPDFEAEILKRT